MYDLVESRFYSFQISDGVLSEEYGKAGDSVQKIRSFRICQVMDMAHQLSVK